MGRPKGKEWDIEVVTKEVGYGRTGDPEVQCVFCARDPLRRGATRIRAHILGDSPALGVTACVPTEENVEAHAAAVAVLVAIQKSTEQTQFRKRKASKLESLESSATVVSSSGRQSTINEGFERLDRAGTDRAVAFMWYAN